MKKVWLWLVVVLFCLAMLMSPGGEAPVAAEGTGAGPIYLPLVASFYTPGFFTGFDGPAEGWTVQSGVWTVQGGTYQTAGLPNYYATVGYSGVYYGNYDYQVRMIRYGGECEFCTNAIIVRGTPNPLGKDDKDWAIYYMLEYDQYGRYTLTKRLADGTHVTFVDRAGPLGDIHPGDWNTLRVTVIDNVLTFYINNFAHPLSNFTETGITFGQVGIGMWRDQSSTDNLLQVDWASLETLP